MEYDTAVLEAIVDLGAVAEETKGGGFVNLDSNQTLDIPAGLSDD